MRLEPWAKRVGIALAIAWLWLSWIRFPHLIAGPELDPSWHAVLNWCALHSRQVGIDSIFIGGPYAWLYSEAYDARLFAVQVAAELLVAGVMATWVLTSALGLPGKTRWACLGVLLLLSPVVHVWKDATYLLVAMLIGVRLCGPKPPSRLATATGATFLALLSLIKFTLFLYTAVVLAIVAIHGLVAPRQRGKPACISLGTFLVAWLALYLGGDQSLMAIPAFIRGGLEIASGHAEAMSKGGPRTHDIALACLILSLWGAAEVLSWGRGRPRPDALARTGLMGTAAFLAWKHGFVRHDQHALLFFFFVAIAPFFSRAGTDRGQRARRVQLALLLPALALGSYASVAVNDRYAPAQPAASASLALNPCKSLRFLLDPPRSTLDLEAAWQAKAQKWALPRIKAAVGDAPVDIVSHGQGIVFLNQLHYDPRPVFQSYIAYTDYLLRRNADHFAQAGGPEYVLIRPEAIDSRLQAMEDSLALRELARRYRPLFVEKGYLLAERIPPDRVASAPSEQVLRALDVGWGEWVDLEWAGDETVYLRLDIRYSPLGQVMKLLLRSPTVEIVLAGPSWAAHDRIVPSMMRAGILLQPYLRRLQSDQVATLWPALSGSTMAIPPDCRVRRFKLDVGNEDWERCFSPRIGVRLVALRSNAAGGDPGK